MLKLVLAPSPRLILIPVLFPELHVEIPLWVVFQSMNWRMDRNRPEPAFRSVSRMVHLLQPNEVEVSLALP